MGLLDLVLGNMMGGGRSAPRGAGSPIMKALMMLLAAKAFQHYTSNRQTGSGGGGFGGQTGGPLGNARGGPFGGALDPRGGPVGSGQGGPFGGAAGSGIGDGLGGLLSGGLGGLVGGLIGGGGLNAIIDQFRQNGYGNAVDSWVGPGQNQRLAPDELAQALGPDTIEELERETGMPRDEVLSELSQELPDALDQFTPDGRIPTEDEVQSRWS